MSDKTNFSFLNSQQSIFISFFLQNNGYRMRYLFLLKNKKLKYTSFLFVNTNFAS